VRYQIFRQTRCQQPAPTNVSLAMRDSAYKARGLLWLAYAVLCAGAILFVLGVFLIMQRGSTTVYRPPISARQPSNPGTGGPGVSPSPGAAPSGASQPEVARAGSPLQQGRATGGYPPGEPPGDIEDDGTPSTASQRSTNGSGRLLPSLPLATSPVPGPLPPPSISLHFP
jgi:hypothetical protein